MAIKAILLDIDGTLTNSKKVITPKTLEALKKAQDQGATLVIASGRPAKGLVQYGNQLDMADHHGLFVCYNGGRVVDCETDQVLVDFTMTVEEVKSVLHHIKQFDLRPVITEGDYMLVNDVYDCMIKDGEREFNVLQYESRMNGYILKEIPDLEEYVDFPCNKILTAADSAYLKEKFEAIRKPFEGKLSSMFTANFYYEFTPMGIDKGAALRPAMEKLGIKPEECIAFGDAENDIPMLQYAGVGVAMGNATEPVKAIADYITLSNEEDGIAEALYKYMPEVFG